TLGAPATAPRDAGAAADGSAAVDSAGKTARGARLTSARSPGRATFVSSLEIPTSAEATPSGSPTAAASRFRRGGGHPARRR
ncbi:MAG TPA: hypothetical protein VN835_03000, partial [Steroidobacteraceae bacterium]|nr:hypothetical protein [Steroidobacteraceae bacterium]